MLIKHLSHLKYFFLDRRVRSVGMIFFTSSFLFGNWVTRIPDVKKFISLSESELGLALLGAPIGALLLMPLAGWLNKKFGLGRSIIMASFIHALSPALLAWSDSWITLAAGLFYFGLTNAWMDVAMNAGAAITERELKKPIMSTAHGMWSLGAMVGSASGSLMLWLEVNVITHLSFSTIIAYLIIGIQITQIRGIHETLSHESKVFALPTRRLLLLAFIAFSIMVGEGAVADWSALYMDETLHSPVLLIGLAFSSFAFLMAIGRFLGDSFIPAFGMKRVVLFGAVLSAISLGSLLIVSHPIIALIGFGLTGLGFSCIVPVIFSSAANEPGFSAGAGIASVTIIGYSGFLVGPPIIGFIAEAYSLAAGFLIVVVLSSIAALLSLRIRF